MDSLIQWDVQLFHLINQANAPWLDTVMSLLSNKLAWIPAYLFLLWSLVRRFRPSSVILILVGVGLLISLTDQSTSSILKPKVKRYRPCRVEAGLRQEVHLVNKRCGGKYGFASSHAANFFGLSVFFGLLFQRRVWWICLIVSASLVAYSRIYLGVHYPGDVLAGALIGGLFGLLVYFLLKKWIVVKPDQGKDSLAT